MIADSHSQPPDFPLSVGPKKGSASKGKSVRESRAFLNEYVQERQEDYKKQGRRAVLLVNAPAQKWRQSFRRQFGSLSEAERAAYLAEMEAFLRERREEGEPTDPQQALVK